VGTLTDDRVTLLAPAKLTLSLTVLGRRTDGLHELAAEMVALDLADELEIEGHGNRIELAASPTARADDLSIGADNLVVRALSVLGRRAGVRVTKRIPVGGGLGGGSSDAAAVLRWAGCEDLELAVGLGSDVPFCLVGGRAKVGGIGEVVTPLDYERRAFVLLVPPFGVDTGEVYRAFDAGAREPGARNELTEAALSVEPRLAVWRDRLAEASGRVPQLAGSGSTWFVEGEPEALGLAQMPNLRHQGEVAPLLVVRTVPAGWKG
jgi:4-diphosphocytidyl-2-C-methyl-D-erythritol kinase